MDVDPELLVDFMAEVGEHLTTAEQDILALERTPTEVDEKTVNRLFRALHSIKGDAGLMDFTTVQEFAHAMEDLAGAIRNGTIAPTPEVVEALLIGLDKLKGLIDCLGDDSIPVDAEMIRIRSLLEQEQQPEQDAAPLPTESFPALMPSGPIDISPASESEPPHQEDCTGPPPTTAAVEAVPETRSAQDIRVNLQKLDDLIALVGELVIAESMVTRHPVVAQQDDESLAKAIHQLRRVSSYLQNVAMSTRMVPLTQTFQKMTRLVHDVSRKSGKQVELEVYGEETEVDRNVIELIADPLVHVVRNAIDHGIEPLAQRKDVGKSETGSLAIEARHEGSEVWILVSDDGRGLDCAKILQRGRERGLIRGDGDELSQRQVFQLIFEPGFSTADQVTELSGRGVGMDVVRANMDRLKGRVDVHSQTGQGTTVVLRIPLTMAIIDGMLVRVGREVYTLPLLAIRETFRLSPKQFIQTPDGQEIVRLREELIPIVRLHRIFNRQADSDSLTDGLLLVVEDNGQPVCLFVDEIMGQQQVVIKGLSDYLGKARAISGCTILADGHISLILDIRGLVDMAMTISAAEGPRACCPDATARTGTENGLYDDR